MTSWTKKRSTMRRYDLTARMYDERYVEEQEAKYHAALYSMEARGAVLDVGCGTGLFFKHIAGEAEKVVGVDVSKQLLLVAKERARLVGNVFLVLADADHLPFEDDLFDVVFSFTVLQNMPKPKDTLTEMHRVVQEGGSVVVTALKKVFSSKAFGELLSRSGLSVVSIKDDNSLKCYVAFAVKT